MRNRRRNSYVEANDIKQSKDFAQNIVSTFRLWLVLNRLRKSRMSSLNGFFQLFFIPSPIVCGRKCRMGAFVPEVNAMTPPAKFIMTFVRAHTGFEVVRFTDIATIAAIINKKIKAWFPFGRATSWSSMHPDGMMSINSRFQNTVFNLDLVVHLFGSLFREENANSFSVR